MIHKQTKDEKGEYYYQESFKILGV